MNAETRLNVAYVVNMFPKISETFIASEIAELMRRGVRCRVLSLKQPSETLRHPIVVERGLERITFYDRAQFERDLRHDPPDLMHAHFATEPTRVAREVATTLGVPFSFTAHAYDIYRKAPVDFAARAAAAGAVITVSDANADYIASHFGVPRGRIRILPCGVDLDQFRPPSTAADAATIVCVSRLRPHKNVEMLLRACRRLVDRGVSFQTVVIGDGPSRPELEATRASLGLDGHVTFVGAQDQRAVAEWWRRATVGALTSRTEGMPVSLMEAAACGVPVVATRVGGVAELVADHVTGFVIESDDEIAATDALARLLQDRALRARMGAAARQRAETLVSVTRQVDSLLETWTGMVTQTRQVVPA